MTRIMLSIATCVITVNFAVAVGMSQFSSFLVGFCASWIALTVWDR